MSMDYTLLSELVETTILLSRLGSSLAVLPFCKRVLGLSCCVATNTQFGHFCEINHLFYIIMLSYAWCQLCWSVGLRTPPRSYDSIMQLCEILGLMRQREAPSIGRSRVQSNVYTGQVSRRSHRGGPLEIVRRLSPTVPECDQRVKFSRCSR